MKKKKKKEKKNILRMNSPAPLFLFYFLIQIVLMSMRFLKKIPASSLIYFAKQESDVERNTH